MAFFVFKICNSINQITNEEALNCREEYLSKLEEVVSEEFEQMQGPLLNKIAEFRTMHNLEEGTDDLTEMLDWRNFIKRS